MRLTRHRRAAIQPIRLRRSITCAHTIWLEAAYGKRRGTIKEHAEIVLDYGVGKPSVDFVTLGVEVLVEYLVPFGTMAAARND